MVIIVNNTYSYLVTNIGQKTLKNPFKFEKYTECTELAYSLIFISEILKSFRRNTECEYNIK
jgi:hypothetical protein